MLKKAVSGNKLADIIVKGMQEKKAKSILKIDLRKLKVTIADYFVICHADSSKQIDAIADSVEEEVRNETGLKPFSREGFMNAEWIIIDYSDVIVHIFIREKRYYYNLEELWDDGKITQYPDVE